MKPIIGITMGDCNGIGPEVVLKCLAWGAVRKTCSPVLIGSLHVFEWYEKRLKLNLSFRQVGTVPRHVHPGLIPVVDVCNDKRPSVKPGKGSRWSGRYAQTALESAVELWRLKQIDAVVTAPVSKRAMHDAGCSFPGQTELIAGLTRCRRYAMVLIAPSLRVCLVTIHTPIAEIVSALSTELVLEKISVLHEALKNDFSIRFPRIAVLGLNPHAGEDGSIGIEEKKYLVPAIGRARRKSVDVEGPFSADGFFGSRAFAKYDAVLAMYHDKGLIPLKLLGFAKGVNYSAGLPVVRTSPDHGTAFDIAGKGLADHRSMLEAMRLASVIVRKRKRGSL